VRQNRRLGLKNFQRWYSEWYSGTEEGTTLSRNHSHHGRRLRPRTLGSLRIKTANIGWLRA